MARIPYGSITLKSPLGIAPSSLLPTCMATSCIYSTTLSRSSISSSGFPSRRSPANVTSSATIVSMSVESLLCWTLSFLYSLYFLSLATRFLLFLQAPLWTPRIVAFAAGGARTLQSSSLSEPVSLLCFFCFIAKAPHLLLSPAHHHPQLFADHHHTLPRSIPVSGDWIDLPRHSCASQFR